MATRTWNSAGSTDLNDGNNYSPTGALLSSDDLVFDGTSTVNTTATAALTVLSLTTNSGYTGTIDNGAYLVTTGSGGGGGDFTWNSGTMVRGAGGWKIWGNYYQFYAAPAYKSGTGPVELAGTGKTLYNRVQSDFQYLTVSGSYTLSQNLGVRYLTVNGTLHIAARSIDYYTYTIDGSGTIDNTSGYAIAKTLDLSGGLTFNCNLWLWDAPFDVIGPGTIGGWLKLRGTPGSEATGFGGTGGLRLVSDVTVAGDLITTVHVTYDIDILLEGYTLSVGGDVNLINTAGSSVTGSGAFKLTGTADQNITRAGATITSDVEVDKSAGVVYPQDDWESGDLTVTDGTLNNGGVDWVAGGNVSTASGTTLSGTGELSWTGTATFTSTTITDVDVDGAGSASGCTVSNSATAVGTEIDAYTVANTDSGGNGVGWLFVAPVSSCPFFFRQYVLSRGIFQCV